MKKVWTILGVAVLAAGLIPYRVEKDEETGDQKFEALLWEGTRREVNGEKKIHVNLAPWFSSHRGEDEWSDYADEDLDSAYCPECGEEVSEPVVRDTVEEAEVEAEPVEVEVTEEDFEEPETQTQPAQ